MPTAGRGINGGQEHRALNEHGSPVKVTQEEGVMAEMMAVRPAGRLAWDVR
jgi:hypothetical protein